MQNRPQARLTDFNNFWWVGRSLHQYPKYTLFFVRNSKWPPYGAQPGFSNFGPKMPLKIPEN